MAKDIKVQIENIQSNFEAPVLKNAQIANLKLNIGKKELINKFVKVKITDAKTWSLDGELA